MSPDDTVDADCLGRLTRLETLRITTLLSRDPRIRTYAHHYADLGVAPLIAGVAHIAMLRRLEVRGDTLSDFSPLTTLRQLEVLRIDDSVGPMPQVTLPRPMPNLRALVIPRGASPPWPSYPKLEQLMCTGPGRPAPDIATHVAQCVGADNRDKSADVNGGGYGYGYGYGCDGGGGRSSRLRWLSLAGYSWLPVGTCMRVLTALSPFLEVFEVGAAVCEAQGERDPTRWRIDARHMAACLAARTGHKMAEMTTEELRRWSASGPAVTAQSLLDF
jgi:hypothetical protein